MCSVIHIVTFMYVSFITPNIDKGMCMVLIAVGWNYNQVINCMILSIKLVLLCGVSIE